MDKTKWLRCFGGAYGGTLMPKATPSTLIAQFWPEGYESTNKYYMATYFYREFEIDTANGPVTRELWVSEGTSDAEAKKFAELMH